MSRKVKSGIRAKTKFPGVFWRYGKNRVCADGKPDICYDILYKKADGKQKMVKVGWRSEGCSAELASQVREERVKAIRGGGTLVTNGDTNSSIVLEDAWEIYKTIWLPNLRRGKDMIARYELYLRPVLGQRTLASIGNIDIEQMKQHLLHDYQTFRGRNGLVPGSVRGILSDLRRIFHKMKEWGYYTGSLPIFHLPPSDDKRERYLSRDEAKKFLDDLQLISCDLYRIAKISLYTGMRMSEILNLRPQDVHLEDKLIYVDGKTGQRVAYISDDIAEEFAVLLAQSANRQFLFINQSGNPHAGSYISSQFNEKITAMGWNDGVTESKYRLVFHSLRHTFCSWLASEGVPLLTIGELVGHTSLEMTRRYAKLSPDNKRAALKVIDSIMRK